LAEYHPGWFSGDAVAGVTLAAYAIPVSLAYAGLAGLTRLRATGQSDIRLVVCDLSASPYVDLAGSRMLHELHGQLAARGAQLRIVGAHGWVRDLLRADGLGEKVGGLGRVTTLDHLLGERQAG
jgi:MFS superfamily sulfate permease-like transporter